MQGQTKLSQYILVYGGMFFKIDFFAENLIKFTYIIMFNKTHCLENGCTLSQIKDRITSIFFNTSCRTEMKLVTFIMD